MEVLNHIINGCKVCLFNDEIHYLNLHILICTHEITCENLDAISAACPYDCVCAIKEDKEYPSNFRLYLIK